MPPVPFWIREGMGSPDFGMKVWAVEEVKAKLPVLGIKEPPERRSALPPVTVRVLEENSKFPV